MEWVRVERIMFLSTPIVRGSTSTGPRALESLDRSIAEFEGYVNEFGTVKLVLEDRVVIVPATSVRQVEISGVTYTYKDPVETAAKPKQGPGRPKKV
jgi:hypothetical protein